MEEAFPVLDELPRQTVAAVYCYEHSLVYFGDMLRVVEVWLLCYYFANYMSDFVVVAYPMTVSSDIDFVAVVESYDSVVDSKMKEEVGVVYYCLVEEVPLSYSSVHECCYYGASLEVVLALQVVPV